MSKEKEKQNLSYSPQNAWTVNFNCKDEIFSFSEGYKAFLDIAKTEREYAYHAEKLAIQHGYISLDELVSLKKPLKPGMKVYKTFQKKACIFAEIGKDSLANGTNMIGSHIDSPRIDVKQNPLYEDSALSLLDTHYYGGIKKYQWVTIPLAIHGCFVKENGEVVTIVIGEDENDPVFTITDLLPHLGADQMQKKATEVISGEELNLLIGSMPVQDSSAKEKFKQNILQLLHEKYEIKEEDFISAELEIVPAFKAKDVGLDRSLVGAYGQDDRVCAYTSLQALFSIQGPQRTAICILTDKEEIGSVGNTGAQSSMLQHFIKLLCYLEPGDLPLGIKEQMCISNSKMLSADVTAGFDPTFPGVHEKKNAAIMGNGLVITKFTGARGKSGASDANAEFVAMVRNLFNEHQVVWQTAELGKVDQGGGGTIAQFVANLGAQVLDCGVAVLSMHAPFEIATKIDIYMAFKGYKVFFEHC